ncbi:hypothetical protein BCIN_01g01610 [Botrytis cinerea B05.10]|uniref:Uncharacterized protein n=2 Tax=Botryotinia fuckeliana TaxID=40559 RepID=A0A384J4C4_BOTFB|nr:hypothetical protein BCIN_01g01610 [Botrytis cinerea B05.10]ATZ45365.1 hypothetical protein BCIN_01g01610 [Botrytis cinerea B05.10]CCD56491.1 similar to short-chain dehydrogenase/reductase [Botrytis cinerea T4]
MGWFTSFLYSQLFVTLPIPTHDFTNQTIIITGSNTGLGLEAARHVSRLNAHLLILAVRSQSKGQDAKTSILASTGRPESSIEVWSLDMQSPSSIQDFCSKANKLPRIDAVLANAGIMTKYFKLVEGHESTVMTNVIGTFQLVFGLLPKLKESAKEFDIQPRVSIVASDLHFIAKFKEAKEKEIFKALNDEKTSELDLERYATTKLLQVFGVRELAQKLTRDSDSVSPSVIANCMTPGACKSDFHREDQGFDKFKKWLLSALLARSTEAGSRTLVAGIAAGEESHGEYMADCLVAETGPLVRGPEGMKLQKKVWDQLMTELEKIQPGVSSN